MLQISATIHVSSERTGPYVERYNDDNGCLHLMLSGNEVWHPYVAAYGTPDELRRWLESALDAIDRYEAQRFPFGRAIA